MITFYMNTVFDNTKNLSEAGKVFYVKIKDAISQNQKLNVNMEGVTSLPSILLNASIGRIIDENGKNAVKEHVGFTMITKQQALRLKDYLNRYQ